MRNLLKTRSGLSRLCKLAAAAGFALMASSSFAGAVVTITSFTVSTDGIPFVADKYAVASMQTADITVSAQNAGGLGSSASNAYSANSWVDASNVSAVTSLANATGTPGKFTDNNTQLEIGIFGLAANSTRGIGAYPSGSLPNTATASANQTGAFSLIDGNGDAVAGQLTFEIYYDLMVSSPVGSAPSDQSTATVNLQVSTDDDGLLANLTDLLLSYNLAGGIGNVTAGYLTYTVDLALGEVVYFALSGTASSSSANVPEPGGLALASVALLALGAASRRRKS